VDSGKQKGRGEVSERVKTARSVRRDLRAVASPSRARVNAWFFKTGPGDYGEGDRFLGVTVPALRNLAGRHRDLPVAEVLRLLRSRWHEERLLALLILIGQYNRGSASARARIHKLYLRNTAFINNWDLVDCSAAEIVGSHLTQANRKQLRRLARSRSLWERRIAMIATFHYIKRGEYNDALVIARLSLRDSHDLIHKAVGWMLREIGKRDRRAEERFLKTHAAIMPRTMLRYAVERFPERRRRQYLMMRSS
jgi:3-methyladenine DNA glycosylase AlkD